MRKNAATFFILSFFILTSAVSVAAVPRQLSGTQSTSTTTGKEVMEKIGILRIPFIKNDARLRDPEVKYCARIFGGTAFVHNDSIAYNFPAGTGLESRRWTIREKLTGSKKTQAEGTRKSPTKVSYFIGNDKTAWRSNVTTFEEVSFGEVYDHIRLHLKAYEMSVEKVFIVEKGGNPGEIAIKVEGAKNLKINQDGELEINRETDILKMSAPTAYQEIDGKKVRVAATYTLKNSDAGADGSLVYGFKVGEYDRTRALIIDPLPKPQATFLGGTSEDRATSIVVSASNVYVVGHTRTRSPDFFIGGASEHESESGGNLDIFVAKLDHDLKNLISIAFIGGGNDDFGNAIALDSTGNVYVAGYSSSNDFPGIAKPRDTYAFILKLSGDLSALNSSPIALAGTNADYANSIAIDPDDFIYVSGYAVLLDTNNHDTNNVDAFVSKHGADLSLVASRLIGGKGSDYAYSVAVNPTDFLYITGGTTSADFPTTSGAYDEIYNGGLDGFLVKLDRGSLNIDKATLIGGSDNDVANSIAVSQTGDVYITGWTSSGGFPTFTGAFDTTLNGGQDVFVSKFNPDLSALLASTFLGGAKSEQANSVALDKAGNVYVTGWTSSEDFPTSTGAFDTTLDGGEDVFVSHLDGNLSALLASTLLGGLSDDVANGISLDGDGNVFVTGYTNSVNFIPPQMSAGFDSDYHGSWDAFVYRQRPDLSKVYSLTVTLMGNGHGRVTSSASGIYCLNSPESDCEEEFNSATTVTLTEAASADSTFAGWAGACILPQVSPDTCVVAVNGTTAVSATFNLITFSIQANTIPSTGGGTISPSGSVSVSFGKDQVFAISPNSGFYIADVLVDNKSIGPATSYSFINVTSGHTITAVFHPNPVINASADSGGTIFPSGSVIVSQGESIQFVIKPDPGSTPPPFNLKHPYQGFFVEDVLVDGTSVGPLTSYEFKNVTEDHTISAIFSKSKPGAPYTIMSTANSGGTIQPLGAVKVRSMGKRNFVIKPNMGFHILDVKIDGQSKGPFSEQTTVFNYRFTNVTASHTIEAIFAPKTGP